MPDVEQLAAAHARASGLLRSRLLELLRRIWRSLTGYRDPDADRLVQLAVPLVAGAQRQMAALTDAYLAAVLTEQQGRPVRPVGLPAELVTGRAVRPVDPGVEYRRPIVEVRRHLAQGKPLAEAAAAGERRLESLASTDVQLAKTHAARRVLARPESGVERYRRVLHLPSCGLCVLASTQHYRVRDLMPIHPGCDCGTALVGPGESQDRVIDPELLDAAHDAIAERFGAEFADRGARGRLPYQDVLLTREHSEIGPVLTVAAQRFRTAAQAQRAGGAEYDPTARRQVRQFDTA